ncbi:MAG: hypothetical protein GY751_19615 [Bacteroidetes bacterium]|nr:hypothetical protein [Bacteroidota bacterium]
MIEIVPKSKLTSADIRRLRELSSQSISEIRKASMTQSPIRIFRIFEGDWESERVILAKISREYSTDPDIPYFVRETEEGTESKFLLPEDLRKSIKGWRSVELETQRNIDLENGYIATPKEFQPHDEDWA